MPEKKLHLNLPKANGLFITATDTGVGKTLVAGAIEKLLADDGIKVAPFKPIATGCRKTGSGLVSTDAEFLAKFSNVELSLDIINPVRYETPASPMVSAIQENRPVNFDDIAQAYKEICRKSNFVIVEGIGGVRVPLTENVDVLDLAKEFALPVIIVARAGLGTINHTLLTIDAVRKARLTLAGVIICNYNTKTDDIAEKTAERTIIKCGNIDVMATIPNDPDVDTEKGILGQYAYLALEEIPFFGIGTK